MTVTSVRIDTAAEAFQHLETLALSGRQMIFRGHREEAWRLASTLHRDKHLQQTHALDNMLSHFIMNLKSVGAHCPFDVEDRRARLEYGRQYGIPSPLIDFSYSPYVAMFFAFNGVRPEESSGRAAIYAVDVMSLAFLWARWCAPQSDPSGEAFNQTYRRFMMEYGKFDPNRHGSGPQSKHFFGNGYPQGELKLFSFPASWNIRMQRQMGAFLYDTNRYGRSGAVDLEDFIEKNAETADTTNPEPPALTKISIPHSETPRIFQRLELAGITGTRLLDDHEGAAADVKNAYVYNRRTGYAWDLIMPAGAFEQ
jgi:hypothetical protein